MVHLVPIEDLPEFITLAEAQIRVHGVLFPREHASLLRSIAAGDLTEAQELDLHVAELWLRRLAYCGGARLAERTWDGSWSPVDIDLYCDFTEKYAQVCRNNYLDRYADHLLGIGEADEESLFEYRLAYGARGDDPTSRNTRRDVGFDDATLRLALEDLKPMVRAARSGMTSVPSRTMRALRRWSGGRWVRGKKTVGPGRPKGAVSPLAQRTIDTLVLAGDPDLDTDELLARMTRRKDCEVVGKRLRFEVPGEAPQQPWIRSWKRSLPEYREIARERLALRRK